MALSIHGTTSAGHVRILGYAYEVLKGRNARKHAEYGDVEESRQPVKIKLVQKNEGHHLTAPPRYRPACQPAREEVNFELELRRSQNGNQTYQEKQ